MATKIQLRGATLAQWTASNPILSERELAIEIDTRNTKIGNGINTYLTLPYSNVQLTAQQTIDLAQVSVEQSQRINADNYLQNQISGVTGGYIGSLQFNSAAPTNGESGYYEFSTAGAYPSWLTPTSPVTADVKVGDKVSVKFTAPSTYIYTYIPINISGQLVSIAPQTFTEADKTIARTNIGIIYRAWLTELNGNSVSFNSTTNILTVGVGGRIFLEGKNTRYSITETKTVALNPAAVNYIYWDTTTSSLITVTDYENFTIPKTYFLIGLCNGFNIAGSLIINAPKYYIDGIAYGTGFQKEDSSNKIITGILGSSTTKFPVEAIIKTAIDAVSVRAEKGITDAASASTKAGLKSKKKAYIIQQSSTVASIIINSSHVCSLTISERISFEGIGRRKTVIISTGTTDISNIAVKPVTLDAVNISNIFLNINTGDLVAITDNVDNTATDAAASNADLYWIGVFNGTSRKGLFTSSYSIDGVSYTQTTNDYTITEKTKLAGIAAGATANASDAQLRDRATHTGTQGITTITGLQTIVDRNALFTSGRQIINPSLPKKTISETLKVLSIGSSYLQDVTSLITDVAIQSGVKVYHHNIYKAGMPYEEEVLNYNNLISNFNVNDSIKGFQHSIWNPDVAPWFETYTNTESTGNTIRQILMSKEWDVILIQQGAFQSFVWQNFDGIGAGINPNYIVATISIRDTTAILAGQTIKVTDNGSGIWEVFKATTSGTGIGANYISLEKGISRHWMKEWISLIKRDATNPNVVIAMSHSGTPNFAVGTDGYYTGSDMTAGFATWDAMWKATLDNITAASYQSGIDLIVPCGMAIYSARTTSLNGIDGSANSNLHNLTRDDLHLDLGIGRYLNACTFFEAILKPIFGVSILGNAYRNVTSSEVLGVIQTSIDDSNALIAQKCAISANANRFDYTDFTGII